MAKSTDGHRHEEQIAAKDAGIFFSSAKVARKKDEVSSRLEAAIESSRRKFPLLYEKEKAMRLYCALVTLVLGSVFLDPARVRCDDEKVFAPKNGMFTITMPAGDTSSDKTKILVIGKHKVPIEASRSGQKDGTTFQGSSMGIPAVVMRDIPADKRFDILRDALVKQLNGKVTDEKDVMKDPIPGKEYTIELPKGVVRMQLYTVTGWVVYSIVEGKTKDDVNTKQSDAFFDSLMFSDNAKDLFRKVKR